MRRTDMDDYRPRPGTLVEFELTARGPAVPHGIPPSLIQQGHMRLAGENRAAGVRQSPWVAHAFNVPGRADVTAMSAALRDFVAAHDSYRAWFEHGGEGGFTGWGYPADAIRVAPREAGEFTDSVALRDHLHASIDAGTIPHSWPVCVAGVILRDEFSTFYLAIDHSLSDGFSMALLFAEMRARYDGHRTGTPVEFGATDEMLMITAREHKRVAELTTDSPEIVAWREFIEAGGGRLPSFPADLGNPSGGLVPAKRLETEIFGEAGGARFRDHCRARDGGFAGGVFAALAHAQREADGTELYRVLTAVTTRTKDRGLRTQGWLINLVPIMIDTRGDFDELIPKAHEAFKRARTLAQIPLHAVIAMLASDGESLSIPPMVSYVNGRGLPGAADYTACDARLLPGPDNAADVSMWFNWMPDYVNVVTQLPDTPEASATAPPHLARVVETIRAAGQ
ncbi:condensation domain-containing protein [Herbihabitans rhizosphaerae]|uniref:Condensation domain-containing protein n=1 Tax=Herbihabitans rhizosphaerae TaxID=1872711 RepID=A0A4Q7L5X7_9PSEU|nr:condensation domain-containing protein [Herbihabitans rhizosphaerae]RZS44745.1 condensation domain-containing protein [Herbihabitans rhizosphaerae]